MRRLGPARRRPRAAGGDHDRRRRQLLRRRRPRPPRRRAHLGQAGRGRVRGADPAGLRLIYKGFLKDHYVQKPIVAAVEGYCYAGGMEILQAFDIRVAAEDAQLAVTEVQRGLFPMSASTIRLPRQIPYTVAMDMLIVGDPITGPAGLRHRPRRPRHPDGRGAGQGPRAGRPASPPTGRWPSATSRRR